MEQKKDSWSATIKLGIVIGMFVLFMVVDCFLIPPYIEAHGTPKTITITLIETGYETGRYFRRSCGYYYVNKKRYKASIDGIFPIGTTFEIKYYPKIPGRYEVNKNKIIVREYKTFKSNY